MWGKFICWLREFHVPEYNSLGQNSNGDEVEEKK